MLPPDPNQQEIDALARTLWGEARGELYGGRVAVGCVVRNRVKLDLHGDNKPDWWGEGYADVCQKPFQFSCWNKDDPNRTKLLDVTEGDQVFAECLVIARQIVTPMLVPHHDHARELPDVTLGATHYYRVGLDYPKSWGKPRRPIIQIGRHLFYNLAE